MSVFSRSAPAPSPAAKSYAFNPEITITEESSGNRRTFHVDESVLKKWQLEWDMRKEQDDEEQQYRNEMKEKMMDAAFEPEAFGDPVLIHQKQHHTDQASLLLSSVVSIALFNGDVLVYACSGIAVRHWHGNIKDFHTIFVTSARLAQKFNDNRTRDDNLRVEVRTTDNRTLVGFLGLYDEKNGIAIVTSLSVECVYTMDTCSPVDLSRGLDCELFAFGCATNGTLMRAKCSHPVFEDEDLFSVNCMITESGRGGPVMYLHSGESGHLDIAGLIVESCQGKTTLLSAKKLHNWLQHVLLITSTTSHFRGYSLPKGVETVIPSGFMVESKILQSLGYPLPPPLLFELNGTLAGSFEEHFGQLHYWEGYPFDFSYDYGRPPIWDHVGELTQQISESVVSVASFKDNKRCFACTGLLITGGDCQFVLTSASLVRTGAVEGEIDEKLTIEVFLPPKPPMEGILELYHQSYNIALVRLKRDPIVGRSPEGILHVEEFTDTQFMEDRQHEIMMSSRHGSRHQVVAIGRATKQSHGLLMASIGELKGKYKAFLSTGMSKKPDCPDLRLSTCQIKKVGIGGPLISLRHRYFFGMNFYDESGTTPFLPRKEILKVLMEGFVLLERSTRRPIKMDLYSKTLKRKRSQWPVSEPYWFLGGQDHPVDQLVGKVLM